MRKTITFLGIGGVIYTFLLFIPSLSGAQWIDAPGSRYDDYPRRDRDRGWERRVIRCESKDFQFQQCPVATDGQVRLVRQISDTQCRRGQNWGYNERGIWVDNGCAAEFRVGGRYVGSYRDRGDDRRERRRGGNRTIRCESKDFEFHRCSAPRADDVRIARQLSDTKCRRGQNWGHDRQGIWVDDGCAAEFYVDDRYASDYYGR